MPIRNQISSILAIALVLPVCCCANGLHSNTDLDKPAAETHCCDTGPKHQSGGNADNSCTHQGGKQLLNLADHTQLVGASLQLPAPFPAFQAEISYHARTQAATSASDPRRIFERSPPRHLLQVYCVYLI